MPGPRAPPGIYSSQVVQEADWTFSYMNYLWMKLTVVPSEGEARHTFIPFIEFCSGVSALETLTHSV